MSAVSHNIRSLPMHMTPHSKGDPRWMSMAFGLFKGYLESCKLALPCKNHGFVSVSRTRIYRSYIGVRSLLIDIRSLVAPCMVICLVGATKG